jgi:pilus assembly protein Flp/PilA
MRGQVTERACGERRMAMLTLIGRLIADDRGPSAIEYGLIAALVAVVIIAAVAAVGTGLMNTFTTISGSLP